MRPASTLVAAALALGVVTGALQPGLAAPDIGWLGVSIADVGEELAERLGGIFGPAAGNGVQVMEVLPGGPSEAALQRGDVIVRMDAQPIWDVRQLQRVVRAKPVQAQVRLTVLRGSRSLVIPVTIGAMPPEARAQLAAERYGFLVREREEPQPGAERPASPVVVAFVDADSPAARADLRPMDRIVQANGRTVAGLRDFEEAILAADASLSLLVQRRGGAEPIALRLEAPPRR